MSVELICLFDSAFTLIRVNQAWPRIFGIAEEVAPGLSLFEFVPKQHHQQVKIDLSVLSPERRAVSYKHAIGLQNHVTAWVDWTYRTILDDHHTIVAFEAIGKMKV